MNRGQRDQQEKKQEDTVAQFIQDRFENDIPARSLTDGVTDYVFRCIQGPFAGNFIYLNLTEEGELIGSDPQADYTLLIENAGLSAQHTKINYTMDDNQYGYFIKDLNSEKGTWIKTKPGHLIQIEDEQIFRIEDQVFQFRLIEDENFDVVVEWLARIELKKVIIKLKSYNIKTLKDIKQLQPNIIDEIIDDEDEKIRFKQAFDTIDQDFPVDGKQKTLLIYSITQDEILAKVKWSGAAITRSSEMGEISGIDKYGVDCNQKFEMIIQFYFNRYYFHVTPKAPGQIYLKLYGNYRLSPDDIVNIGNLDFQVQRFNTGLWSDKGTRMTMEDRSVISQSIPISRYFSVSYFAVFDGHGGDQCAQFLYETLGEKLKEEFMNSEEYLDDTEQFYYYIYEKLVYIINDIDQQFWQYRMNDQDNNSDSGSAGVIILIFGTKIISVNVGDCRAVLSRQGKPVALTVDHKPNEEKEKQRIMKAGGTVDGNRVNKKLAVSRAFGDFSFKKETTGNMDIVTVNPDIRVWDIDFMVDEFIVLGCDGLFDMFNNQQVVEYVRERIIENQITEQDPQKVARQICLDAVEISKQQKRGSDNCSVIIILLTRGIVNSDKIFFQ